MSLSLTCARATITKLVPDRRADDDGAKYTTIALKIEIKTSADILAEFHPELRHAWFKGHGGVRFPSMKEVGWEGRRRGVDLDIRPGPDLAPAVRLTEVALREFKLKPFTEGTQDLVMLRFVADVENPSVPVGRILEYLKEAAWIDLKASGELDLPPPSAGTTISGLDAERDTKVTITAGETTVETTVERLQATTERMQVEAIRRLQPSRKGAQAKLKSYPDEVLRAAIEAESKAPDTRALMVAMLEAELARRATT
ncbi:MAG: hypothetical protein IPM64_17695 [Phycisphaerales bacterium]|nr:hypothetical protein [Phycisphaerales bacterium]